MTVVQKIGAAEAAPHALPSLPCLARPGPAPPCPAPPSRDEASYHRKLARLLDHMGGTYLVSDILTAISEGRMQSFCCGNSWVVTQIVDFPRARQLQLLAYVGDLADVDALHAQLLDYADENNCGLLSTYGRAGWLREGSWRRLGWRLKAKNFLYQREM